MVFSQNDFSSEERAWRDSKLKNLEIDELNIEDSNFTHALELTLVNLRGSGWNKPLITKAIARAAEVYKKCGIKVKNPLYIEIDPPYGRVDISDQKDQDYELALLLPTKKHPVVFFIRSHIEGENAFSWSKDSSYPPLADTAFITANVNTEDYINKRQKNYSPTAHEIAHLLCDCDHIEGKEYNLLSRYYNRASSDITKAQCDTFKTSDLLKRIKN